MVPECAFNCGNSKYYLHNVHGRFLVERQDWLGKTFVGFAGTVAEALTLVKADARSGRIVAVPLVPGEIDYN